MAESKGRGKIGGGAAEEGVGEAVGWFLGVGVRGGRRGAFLADFPEAEDQQEETRKRRSQTAGERRDEMISSMVGRRPRRRRQEVAGGHIGKIQTGVVALMSTTHNREGQS